MATIRSVVSRAGVTGLAGGTIYFRSLTELIPLHDVLLSGIVLLSTASLYPVAGWVLAWALLGAVVYVSAPSLFAGRLDGLGSDPILRVGVVAVSVFVGLYVYRGAVVETMGHGSMPIHLGWTLPLLVVGAVLLLRGCCALAVDGERNARRHVPDDRVETVFVGSLLLAVILGVVLAAAELLYPLPELLLVWWALAAAILSCTPLDYDLRRAVIEDPVQRLLPAARAIWAGKRGIVVFFYVCIGLLFSLALVIDARQDLVGIVREGDLTVTLYVVLLFFGPAVYGVWYWLRIVDRLPLWLTDDGRPSDAGAGRRNADPTARAPDTCVPIALYLIVAITAHGGTEGSVPDGYLALAAAVTAVAAGIVLRTFFRPPSRYLLSDRQVIPAAIATMVLGITLSDVVGPFLHAAVTDQPLPTLTREAIQSAALDSGFVLGLALVPYWIPDMLEHESEAVRYLGVGVAGFAFAVVLGVVGGMEGPLLVLGGLLMIAAIVVSAASLLLLVPSALSAWYST